MRETFQHNKAILGFGSLLSGAIATMLLVDHSSDVTAIIGAFLAFTALSFLIITLALRYILQK